LSVEGSRFFRELMIFYGLRLHDVGPNSILQVSAFTFLCEAYLRVAPTMGLWLETFFKKQQTETAGGPPLALGAVSFQRRARAPYAKARFIKKVVGWTKTFFYVKNTVPASQARFLPFSLTPFVANKERLTSRAGPAETSNAKALQTKISILCRRDLRFRTLVGSWISHRIVPLAPRP
jgi:hypothetical protein